MDVEKTIQFLTENASQHDARLAALEGSMLTLGNGLVTLTSVVKSLADNLSEHERMSSAAFDEMRKQIWERDAKLDARISDLVRAIAALANGRSQSPPRH